MIEKEIEWNLNQGFGMVLLQLIDEVNKASMESNQLWFTKLRTLYINIEGIKKVDPDALAKIDEKMLILSNKFGRPEPMTREGRAFQMASLKKINRDLDEINRDLMKEINRAELIKFHIDYADPKKSILK